MLRRSITGHPHMDLQFGFDAGIVTVRLGGRYSTADATTALAAVLPEPSVAEVRGTLLDLRRSIAIETRTAEELREWARYLASMSEFLGRRAAILVGSDLAYGLARMVAARIEESILAIKIVRDEIEGLDWLER
jgi:hypothetical protein